MSKVTTNATGVPKTTTTSENVTSLKDLPTTAIDTFGGEFKAPDYSMMDILNAIPKHCYERRTIQSLHYVFRDFAAMFAIGYIGMTYIPLVESTFLRFILWNIQAFTISLFGFGLWILAHESGHGAFSDYPLLNDFVGWVLHSYLLTPYFSWKYSHARHHQATGHLTRDTAFVPYTKEEFKASRSIKSKISEVTEDAPLRTFFELIFRQIFGLHIYLFTNASGQPYPGYNKLYISHFNPVSPAFEKKEFWGIVLSDIGMISTFAGVYFWAQTFGFWSAFINWFVPFLWVNHWLVFVTFLQHTDPKMPHYDASAWTFTRGAAATIDRNFGFIDEHIFHRIIGTHVLHHYVSRIPHYNAREATEAIKGVMKEHYKYNGENMWISLWKTARSCQFVEGENGIRMFRNINGIGIKPNDNKD
ncbi:hypothetical protein WICMUC_002504 [Wickerhamomyces mucosus]|uniref:Fatty acid desaturase domain-containing protein n=1 Tax=Wickerhamomyces mucosus TaxID=1378264 RepID=A0A9P8PPJ1_9ASCO|nr:hypothetical protein WICMUC_002504 [Wickerhamomyces mucosus]